jgi:hypothetical protein
VPAPAVSQPVAADRGADVEELLARARGSREQRKVKFGRPAVATAIDPKPHAGEPASAEVVMQRIRERAAAKLPRSCPRHWTEQRRLFAIELLAADGTHDRRWCGQFVGWRYRWYGPDLVDKAVDECAAKFLMGAPAIRFLQRYPFTRLDDRHDTRLGSAEDRSAAP